MRIAAPGRETAVCCGAQQHKQKSFAAADQARHRPHVWPCSTYCIAQCTFVQVLYECLGMGPGQLTGDFIETIERDGKTKSFAKCFIMRN